MTLPVRKPTIAVWITKPTAVHEILMLNLYRGTAHNKPGFNRDFSLILMTEQFRHVGKDVALSSILSFRVSVTMDAIQVTAVKTTMKNAVGLLNIVYYSNDL